MNDNLMAGFIKEITKFRKQSKFDFALEAASDLFYMAAKKYGDESRQAIRVLLLKGDIYYDAGQYSKAIAQYEDGLTRTYDKPDDYFFEYYAALTRRAKLYVRLGNLTKAAEVLHETLDYEDMDIDAPYEYATNLKTMALIAFYDDRYEDAKQFYESGAYNIDGPSEKIADFLIGLHPELDRRLGNTADAVEIAVRLEELMKMYKLGAQKLGFVYNDLALINLDAEDYSAASEYFDKARAVFEKNQRSHTRIAQIMNNEAVMYGKQGRYAETLKLLKDALRILTNEREGNYVLTSKILLNIGIALFLQNDYFGAISKCEEALSIQEKHFKEYPNLTFRTLRKIYLMTSAKGDFLRAEMYCRRAMRWAAKQEPIDITNDAALFLNLAELYKKQGRFNAAATWLMKILKIAEYSQDISMSPTITKAYNNLQSIHFQTGDYERLKKTAENTLAKAENTYFLKNADAAELYSITAFYYAKLGNAVRAEVYLRESAKIRLNQGGKLCF